MKKVGGFDLGFGLLVALGCLLAFWFVFYVFVAIK